MQQLSRIRAEIDDIDARLLELLNRRAACAMAVGEIKAAHGEAGFVYRPEREAQILRRISEMNAGRADDIAGGQLQTVPFQELIEFSLDQSRMIRTAQY